LRFALRVSGNKGSLRVDAWFGADVFHAPAPIGAEEVETEAVLPCIEDAEQATSKDFPLSGIDEALEYRRDR